MSRGQFNHASDYETPGARARGIGGYDRSSRNDRNRSSDNYRGRVSHGRLERMAGQVDLVDDFGDDDGDYFRNYYGAGRGRGARDTH